MCRPSLTSLVSVVWRSNASLKLNSIPRQQGFECRYQRRSVEGCTYGVASGFIIYLTEALLFRFWSLLVTKHLLPYWPSGILLGARGTGFVMFGSLEKLLDGLMLKQKM